MNFFQAHDCTEYKDAHGRIPEIVICDGNRSVGKTTAYIRKMIEDYKNDGKLFMYIFRFRNELQNPSETIFKDVKALFFPEDVMTHRSMMDGLGYELLLNGEKCGYAVPLNLAFKLKRFSHYFSDTSQMLFDEYQTEEMYCAREVDKLKSLHKSVARGQGKAVRFVPLYMLSNSLSIFNPYYQALGITSRIKSDTKILRGDGFVLTRVTMKDVQKAQSESPFVRAFGDSDDNTFLNDDDFNVVRLDLKNSAFIPLFVFRYKGSLYTVYDESRERIYVKEGGDVCFHTRYGVTMKDRLDGYLPFYSGYYKTYLQDQYAKACTYFSSMVAKESYMQLLIS